MKIGKWGGLLLAAAMLLAGCGDFWQAPNGGGNGEYTLTNSGSISVAPGSTNQATITVTPENSFSGTVTLSCAITSSPSGAVDPTTCTLSPSSVSVSGSTAQTSTLTATTESDTTTGAYEITVTGAASGYSSETTTVCVEVSTSSGTCGSSGGTSGVFYVLDQTTNQIVATTVTSGSPGSATENAYTLPAEPWAIAVAPNGQFLYVSTTVGIYLYNIGSGGALSLGNGGNAISPDPATAMQVDSTNSWLVEGVTGIAQLNAINITSSGTLAVAGESQQIISLPSTFVKQLAISPGDSGSCGNCYVFVAMGSGGTELINFDPVNANPFGATGTIQLKNASGGSNTVAVDPSNRLLYVGEAYALPSDTQSGGLRAFTIANNGVTEISGSPYSSQGTGPISILPSADGNYVYIANQAVSGSSTDNIASFSVSTSSLTYIATATAGPAGRIGLAEDSTGTYLLAVDAAGNPDLEGYSMSSGTLTSVLTGTTGNDPVGAYAIASLP